MCLQVDPMFSVRSGCQRPANLSAAENKQYDTREFLNLSTTATDSQPYNISSMLTKFSRFISSTLFATHISHLHSTRCNKIILCCQNLVAGIRQQNKSTLNPLMPTLAIRVQL